MNTKLTINLKDGILDIDGSEEFVRCFYEDFKGEVAKRAIATPTISRQIDASPLVNDIIAGAETHKDKPSKSRAKRSSNAGEGQKKSGTYKPSFDASLNLKGLPEFYDSLAPTNAAEKILVFAAFLLEQLNMQSFNADHIYTCFFSVKDRTKIPEAFAQAFHNTQARTHYIQMNSIQEISLTTAGHNRLEEMKKLKAAA